MKIDGFVLKQLFESDFVKDWIANREADIAHEKEFYGYELEENVWRANLISAFFEQDFQDIVKVFPWIMDALLSRIEDKMEDFEALVRRKPEAIYDWIDGKGRLIPVDLDLNNFLGDLERDFETVFKKGTKLSVGV